MEMAGGRWGSSMVKFGHIRRHSDAYFASSDEHRDSEAHQTCNPNIFPPFSDKDVKNPTL